MTDMQFPRLVAPLLCVAIGTSPVAGQRGRGAPVVTDPAATAEIVVRPVRNGSEDVQYVDIREVFTRSVGTTSDNLTVQVPEPPPVGTAPAGLEILEMTDAKGTVPVRNDSGGARRWRAERQVTYPLTMTFKARMWPPG